LFAEFYEISDQDVLQPLVKMIVLQVLLVVTWDVLPITALCGHPSIPVGTVILQPESEAEPRVDVWEEGAGVEAGCAPGWFPVSGRGERTCGPGGLWSPLSLVCEENLALHQPSLQSGSFQDNLPHLAVDGDRASCSSTLRSGDQRWWQVQISSSQIERIQVTTSPPSLVTALSVFLIQLQAEGRALYKPCSLELDRSTTVQEFSCGLEQGEYVYIRDDRLTEEHLTICEVTVIPVRDPDSCGTPDSPALGSVQILGKCGLAWPGMI